MLNINKNRLFLFWKVGKFVFKKQKSCENAILKYAKLCQYHYGMSYVFTRENVRYMTRFYQFFPIYLPQMNKLKWEHYLELLKINNLRERYFYFKLTLFCKGSVLDLRNSIKNEIYNLI